jgi:hypothetical protein
MTEGRFAAQCAFVVEQEMVAAGNEWLPGQKSWHGTFTTKEPLAWSGDGTIELEDGSKGSVIVTRVTLPAGHGTFVGSGIPPSAGD